MYDMYRWDRPASATDDGTAVGTNHRSPASPARAGQTPAARAVQVALDRRDNGGDSSASRDQ